MQFLQRSFGIVTCIYKYDFMPSSQWFKTYCWLDNLWIIRHHFCEPFLFPANCIHAGIHTKAAHTDDNLQQELHSTAYDSSKPGITQQWCKLYHSLSPTQRTLLCCSATVHLASTFLRFAISNWFPIMLLKQKEEFGYGRSSSKI